MDRGIYPSWDAHDRRSLALAEKLGYRLERAYPAYWVEERAGYREQRLSPEYLSEKRAN